MQPDLFTPPKIDAVQFTEELFAAYYECRKNKRNTSNALRFEVHLEANLFKLRDEILAGTYQPGRSIAFIVEKPVKREVFAADFRDRVVHHFVIGKLNPLFETLFIENSYACRKNKGTLFGINQVYGFIKSESNGYSTDAYILKLDVQGFFMHIDKGKLWKRLESFIQTRYHAADKALVVELSRKIIENDPTQNCTRKGSIHNWDNLPKDKSLFFSPPNCGLPIGNLSSQVFANFYLHPLDEFVTANLGFRSYGRYVDDFVVVSSDNDKLKTAITIIRSFLEVQLSLRLHPRKIYFQHYSKGVKFLGVILKPGRKYIANRTKGNFYESIEKLNQHLVKSSEPCKTTRTLFLSSINSYLGIIKHCQGKKLGVKMIQKRLHPSWWAFGFFNITKWKFIFYKKRKKPVVLTCGGRNS
jgi:retron-type reverse transcriptase